ncbi:alpha/beta hydrolase family protein [Actinocrispum wychmicini]|uniref:Serine aminopeptidase S33 family n=1 Tax=Actinocrispum wychmicini TaxID=1213861 RepID=A0A4R2K5E3_9PSEU|nr:alpha/beta fold hydrolase [Actinocrispum wychmicini]TCO65059.1 serine aminopeptidase S33 family [Actinocrispum wychmicini]
MGRITADGVRLDGFTSTPRTPSDLAIVIAHGFSNHVRKPAFQRIAAQLAGHFGIVALSFRGHGRSGGRTSIGPAEVADLAAGVDLARELGYPKVATLGFSMGAAVSLLHAARYPVDAVVSVSSPSRWYVRQTAAMRRLHWLVEAPHARLLAPLLGVRMEQPWALLPTSPIEVVHRIEPPLLIVHGERDHYFPVEHGMALHRAAGRAELWLEPGMAHAETSVTPDLVDRIGTWLNRTRGDASNKETSTRVVA